MKTLWQPREGEWREGVRVTDLKLRSRHKWNESEKTGLENSGHGTTCFLFTQGEVGDYFAKVQMLAVIKRTSPGQSACRC